MTRDAATEAQVRAARPDRSSWVVANAGSGKTRVLTDRVARLLLRGADPQRILCLTYTKAAAGEMQNRLFDRLGSWAMLPDAALRDALSTLDEDRLAISQTDVARARTLFARALEAPGGLRIQTIHAFCEALLRRFPLEAGVTPRFEVLEDRQAAQERRATLEALAEDPASGFAELVPHLSNADSKIDDLLAAVLTYRDRLQADPDAPALRRTFGLDVPPPDPRGVLNADQRAALIEAITAVGGKAERAALPGLAALQAGANDMTEALTAGFLTGQGDPRTHNMGTNALRAQIPDAAEQLHALAHAVADMHNYTLAGEAYARTQALLRTAQSFLMAYDARKLALGVLEFDDMIRAARRLLAQSETADWIRYRLDGGIHHILIDEAQDTSPTQWQVIDAIAGEFFAGEGASTAQRTLFVVGDAKQSIYSFQGADPAIFGDRRSHYANALNDISDTLERCDLLHSFRSAPPILSLVDQVFADKPGIAEPAQHQAFKTDLPGRIDLWDWQAKAEDPPEAPWSDPLDRPRPGAAHLVLAHRIATTLAEMLARGAALPGAERAIRPSDVLILVRSRGPLFAAILSALKDHGVPVAGADRLRINNQLIVRDLLGLLSAVATGADDLGLAAALRSPLGGLTEAQLFTLAHGRPATLAEALLTRTDPSLASARALYTDLRANADFLRPYEMLQRILTRHKTAPRIRARLGAEAEEAVTTLLDLALDYERVEPPTLTGFLAWMSAGDAEVKRQLDPDAGEVRVMTVHGAKGLEAPIVILPDTGKRRSNQQDPLVPLGPTLATLAQGKPQPPVIAQERALRKDLDAQEQWRLFYVAMTRAEQWLIIAGGGEDPGTGADSWYAAAQDGLTALGATPTDGGHSLQYRWQDSTAPRAPGATRRPVALPDWATQTPPAFPDAEPPLAPSRDGALFLSDATAPLGTDDVEAARLYGAALHRLLEHLPQVPQSDWPALAETLVGPAAPAGLLDDARTLLNDPALSWIFAPGSLAEVPIQGRVSALGGRAIRGQIDRLVPKAADEIWLIDFKSTQDPPDQIPPAIAGQLALYVLALQDALPGKTLHAAVLWTRSGRLAPLPHETVSAVARAAASH